MIQEKRFSKFLSGSPRSCWFRPYYSLDSVEEYLRVTFLGKDAETKQLVDDLNRLFGSEQRFILTVTYASNQRVEEGTKKISEQVAATGDEVKKVLGVVQGKAQLRCRASSFKGVRERAKNVPANEDKVNLQAMDNQLKSVLAATTAPETVEEIYVRNKRALLKGTGVSTCLVQRRSMLIRRRSGLAQPGTLV